MDIIDKVIKKMMSAGDDTIYNHTLKKLDIDGADVDSSDGVDVDIGDWGVVDYNINVKSSYGVADGYFDTADIFTFTYGGSGGTTTVDLDAGNKLNKLIDEQLKEENLRTKHKALRDAYDHYQLIKKLVEDTESDKYFEDRYKDFKQP